MSTHEADPAREELVRELLEAAAIIVGLLGDISDLEALCYEGRPSTISCVTAPQARRFLRRLAGHFRDSEALAARTRPSFASYHAWPGREDYPFHPERAEIVDQINRGRMWEGDPWGCAVQYPQEPLPE